MKKEEYLSIKTLKEASEAFEKAKKKEELTNDEKIAKDVQMRLNKLFVPPRIDLNDKD